MARSVLPLSPLSGGRRARRSSPRLAVGVAAVALAVAVVLLAVLVAVG